MSKYYHFFLLNVNGYTPEKIHEQEQFIINSLKVEDNACKGCKAEAIRYHEAIMRFMEEYDKLLTEINKYEVR